MGTLNQPVNQHLTSHVWLQTAHGPVTSSQVLAALCSKQLNLNNFPHFWRWFPHLNGHSLPAADT